MATFSPPYSYLDSFWNYSRQGHRLWSFYMFPRAMAVLMRNGRFVEVAEPYIAEVEALIEGETYFQGGRVYDISAETASALEANGFEVSG